MKSLLLFLLVSISCAHAMQPTVSLCPLTKKLTIHIAPERTSTNKDYRFTVPIRPTVLEYKKFFAEKILGVVQDSADNVIIPIVATVKDADDLLIVVKVIAATQQAERFYYRNISKRVEMVQIKQKLAHGSTYIAKFCTNQPYRKVMVNGVINKASCKITGN